MLDFNAPEFLVVALVALVVIGPKDLPKALRVLGKWVGRARGVARHFRTGIDAMIRESELAEMEKQWAAENERIMREFPSPNALASPPPALAGPVEPPVDPEPMMVEQPMLRSAPEPVAEPAPAPKPKPSRKPAAEAVADAPKPRAPRKPRAKAQS